MAGESLETHSAGRPFLGAWEQRPWPCRRGSSLVYLYPCEGAGHHCRHLLPWAVAEELGAVSVPAALQERTEPSPAAGQSLQELAPCMGASAA